MHFLGEHSQRSLIFCHFLTFFLSLHSIDKVSKIGSPVLVIHGTEDEVIDFSHGVAIYEKCNKAVDPLWLEGAGHNDCELYHQYLERLKKFITVDLKTISGANEPTNIVSPVPAVAPVSGTPNSTQNIVSNKVENSHSKQKS